MKVSYIGNFEPEFSTENDVRKAFEFLGWEVKCLQENQVTTSEVLAVATNSDLLLITGTWDDALPLKNMLGIFKRCAELGIPTATLHLDTFWPVSRGDRAWWLHPMFHTSHIFTADGDHQGKWEGLGKQHTWLRPAIRHDAVHKGNFRSDYECDVAFVGSNGQGYHEDVWSYRKDLLAELWVMCRRNGWTFKNPGGDMPKIERSAEMNNFYASAKVTVGDSLCLNKEDALYWSDRAYEAPGRHGLLIMPKIKALSNDYEGKLPMYEWGDWVDLEGKIEALLDYDFNQQVRNDTYEIVKKNHTYVNRVQEMLGVLNVN